MNAVKNWCLGHPRTALLAAVVAYITVTLFANVKAVYISDMYIYIQMSQVLFSGGTLYREAIDTKNMGFLFFFYWVYWPYAKLFATMDWFFVYEALILTFWYWGSALLIRKIMLKAYTEGEAFVGAFAYVVIMNMIPQTYFINQPQVAVMLHLLYIYAALCLHGRGAWVYSVYGLLLGLGFAMAGPYIFLTLSIPALAWLELRDGPSGKRLPLGNFPYKAFVLRCALAFGGFITALLPYFWYFYSRNALGDWFHWQYTFATGAYSSGSGTGDFVFNSLFQYSNNILGKLLLGVMSIMGSFVILSPYLIDSIFHMVFVDVMIIIWGVLIFKRLTRGRPVFHDYGERLIFITCVYLRGAWRFAGPICPITPIFSRFLYYCFPLPSAWCGNFPPLYKRRFLVFLLRAPRTPCAR